MFPGLAVIALLTFSVTAIQAGPSTKIQAIKDCRAELGERAKYLEVRACVRRKMKRECRYPAAQGFRTSSGSLAKFAAMRRALSRPLKQPRCGFEREIRPVCDLRATAFAAGSCYGGAVKLRGRWWHGR